jgi:titin
MIAPAPVPQVVVVTSSTPDGQVGLAYSQTQLEASGGAPPYAWATSGQLPPGLALSDSGLLTGTPTSAGTFEWNAIVTDTAGNTASRALATTIAPQPVPAAPTALRVTGATKNLVRLAWTDNSTNETGFGIEISTDGANFSVNGTVGAGVTTFNSTGLRSARTYYFRVRALGASGPSPYSNVVSATPGGK